MQIVLVAPRHRAVEDISYEPMKRAVVPPLALLTVAALTPPEHDVRIIDEGVERLPADLEADLVGITATTSAAPRAYQIADQLRARGIRVVMGGMHASAMPDEACEHADAVVIGEAEGVWARLLEDAQRGELKRVYKSEGWPDLSAAPTPRWDLIDPRRYVIPNTTQTTRGCPYDCAYCSVTTFFGHTYRTRRVEDVIAELEQMPPGPLVFVDDNIMGNVRYARELFAALRGAGRRWFSQASVTMLKTPDLIREASRAGCRFLFVGLESISQESLADVDKRINVVEQYDELVKRLHDNGIGIVGSFMFGLDHDDPDVFDRTVEFAKRTKIDACLFSILTPLPGTRLYDSLSSQGRIIDRDWSHYDGAHVVYRPARLTVEQLQEGYYRANQLFYSVGSILRRAIQPFGLHPWYWIINTIWRRYVLNWLGGTALHKPRPTEVHA